MPRVQVNFGVRCKLTDNYGTIKSIIIKNETDEHNTSLKTRKVKLFYILWEGYNVPVPHTRRDFTMDHTIFNSLKVKAAAACELQFEEEKELLTSVLGDGEEWTYEKHMLAFWYTRYNPPNDKPDYSRINKESYAELKREFDEEKALLISILGGDANKWTFEEHISAFYEVKYGPPSKQRPDYYRINKQKKHDEKIVSNAIALTEMEELEKRLAANLKVDTSIYKTPDLSNVIFATYIQNKHKICSDDSTGPMYVYLD
jgi:hypothetical protein